MVAVVSNAEEHALMALICEWAGGDGTQILYGRGWNKVQGINHEYELNLLKVGGIQQFRKWSF